MWKRIAEFLTEPEVFLGAVGEEQAGHDRSVGEGQERVTNLERKLADLDRADRRAYSGFARELTSESTYTKIRKEIETEQEWLREELSREASALKSLEQRPVSVDAVKDLRQRVIDRLESASFDDRKFVLDCLAAEATVSPSGATLSLEVPKDTLSSVTNEPRLGRGVTSPIRHQRLDQPFDLLLDLVPDGPHSTDG